MPDVNDPNLTTTEAPVTPDPTTTTTNAPSIPPPVFPEVPATDPTVVPPVPGATYDQWFLLGCNILSDDGSNFSSESFWVKGNATELSTIRTNNILRNITSVDALVEQLGQEWLDANPDVIEIMPQFLTVLAKIANRQGVL
jgi:hypothetical protein